MPRFAYVNGRYVPHRDGMVHIEDRGYQFADAVYEVVPVTHGILVDEDPHLDRLERSLSELRIPLPMSRKALKLVSKELMRRNALSNGFLYMQVSRGVAPRDHKFPKGHIRPALVMTTRQTKPTPEKQLTEGVSISTQPDIRWGRCDIKSVSLLPNVLAKQKAVEEGAFEAWLVDGEGRVTEGSSTNAWIVTREGKLVTRDASNSILNGITRMTLLKMVAEQGVEIEERAFTLEEALEAREAFLTSSTNFVTPITKIDGKPVGNGHPGILTMQLRRGYEAFVAALGQGREAPAAISAGAEAARAQG